MKSSDAEERSQSARPRPASETASFTSATVAMRRLHNRCEESRARRMRAGRRGSQGKMTPDGVVYVAATREVWVTLRTRRRANAPGPNVSKSSMLPIHHLKWKTKIPLENLAEGYAVDNRRSIFYTNIEDSGTTLAIDVHTHKVSRNGISAARFRRIGPRHRRGFLFVACGDHVVSIDVGHDGKVIDSLPTGAGLDNIDYSSDRKLLYAAAAQAATLTIAEVGRWKFHPKATVPTIKGVRGIVAGKGETAYMIDPAKDES